ncbi:MAG: hypothetical protein M3P18_19190 [Actinomycetota bacterium]|nr:hypothetical protein [Actinomycetota bacterium]
MPRRKSAGNRTVDPRLGPSDRPRPSEWQQRLGRKVSIRYRYRGDPAHPFSEAIGVVASVAHDTSGSETVTIITRRGSSISIPTADVVAAKLFPI